MIAGNTTRPEPWPLRALCVACGAYAVVAGAVTLSGWALGVYRLTDWENDGISMKANAALVLILLGVGVLLSCAQRSRRGAFALGAAAALIGLLTLVEHATRWDLWIDTALFSEPVGARATAAPGRMGPPASTSAVLLGVGLCAVRWRRWRGVSAALGLAASGIALLSIVGYLYGADQLFTIARLTGISLQMSVSIFVLGVGLVLLAPERQPVRSLAAPGPAGALARRSAPVIVLAPVLLGYAGMYGLRRGLTDPALATALVCTALIVVMSALLAWGVAAVAAGMRTLEARESALATSESRLAALVDGMADAFFAVDHELRYQYLNAAARTLLESRGIRADALLGRPANVGDLGVVSAPALERALLDGAPVSAEELHGPWGRWYDVRAFPIHAGGAGVIVRDVTESRRALRALTESETLFRTLGEAVPDLLWMSEGDGTPIYQNPAWHAYTGLGHADPSWWQTVSHADDRARLQDAWRYSRVRGSGFDLEVRLRGRDGAHRWFRARTIPLRDASNSVTRWVGTLTDIHERKLAEVHSAEQAVELAMAVSRLTSQRLRGSPGDAPARTEP